jgi:IclR family transcriptional regulator, pca regulon regulatory protein
MRKNQPNQLTPVSAVDRHFVTSLQKGLDVLTCFGRQHNRLTLSR